MSFRLPFETVQRQTVIPRGWWKTVPRDPTEDETIGRLADVTRGNCMHPADTDYRRQSRVRCGTFFTGMQSCTVSGYDIAAPWTLFHSSRLQQSLLPYCWPFDAHSCHIMGTAIKHPVPDRVKPSFVIFDTLTLSREHQSARMSKITNDGLNRSDTGCFIAVSTWQQWTSNG